MRSLARFAIPTLLALVAVLVLAYAAGASIVNPVTVGGNPKLCACGFRVDGNLLSDGETTTIPFVVYCPVEDTTIAGTVTISVYRTASGQEFDFSSTIPIGRVVAKGGKQGANIYTYDPPVTQDSGLHAPTNPSGYWADLSHIDFCFKPGGDGGNGGLYTVVTALKFYDRDMDGVRDADEPGIDGWLMRVSGDYDDATVTANGGYVSWELADGSYTVSEELPPAGSHWKQTTPEGNLYAFTIPDSPPETDLLFGNVCEVTLTCGRTLGFWSNKNGQAVLAAHSPAWMTLLAGYNLVGESGSPFDPATPASLKAWLLNARSVNMSYMLSAQLAATVLDLAYTCPAGTADAYGIVVDGEWKSLATLVAEANDFLGDHPSTYSGDTYRDDAEWYKDVFDAFNNNRLVLVPYDPCPVPVWP